MGILIWVCENPCITIRITYSALTFKNWNMSNKNPLSCLSIDSVPFRRPIAPRFKIFSCAPENSWWIWNFHTFIHDRTRGFFSIWIGCWTLIDVWTFSVNIPVNSICLVESVEQWWRRRMFDLNGSLDFERTTRTFRKMLEEPYSEWCRY